MIRILLLLINARLYQVNWSIIPISVSAHGLRVERQFETTNVRSRPCRDDLQRIDRLDIWWREAPNAKVPVSMLQLQPFALTCL